MSSAASYSADDYSVYLGFWTNWSHGKIKGATVTLTRQNGGLLIAFLALFVATSGKSFWRLTCFALHGTFSSPRALQDGLYHQRQAILRNSETAEYGAWQLFKTMLVWSRNKSARRPIRRLAPVAILGSLILGSFTVAGIFSSHVSTDNANEVLLTGNDCGVIDLAQNDMNVFGQEINPYMTQQTKASLNYVLQCYSNETSSTTCQPYVKRRLDLNVNQNASCPFEADICKTPDQNLILDSGYINSHNDLGINAPSDDRFLLRSIHHCAPLKTEGFSEIYNATDFAQEGTTTPVLRMYYGPLQGVPTTVKEYTNYTYQLPVNNTHMNLAGYVSTGSPTTDYILGRTFAYNGNTSDAKSSVKFKPAPQLQQSNADVLLFFLSAPTVLFLQETDDLWFSAHKPGRTILNTVTNKTTVSYYADEPASAVGCTVQTQYCDAHLPENDPNRCGTLNGQYDDKQIERVWADAQQRRKMYWVYEVLYAYQRLLNTIVDVTGATALVARNRLKGQYQSAIAPNQWQIEMQNLVSTSLATMQGAFVEAANGQSRPGLKKAMKKPNLNDTGALHLCKSQKIYSTRFSSFNVLGLSLIITLGGIFIFLDLFLEPMVRWFHSRKAARIREKGTNLESGNLGERIRSTKDIASDQALENIHKRCEWNATSILQLQRLAHEAIGCGTWTRTTNETPITAPGQTLGILRIDDSLGKHPRYVNPASQLNEVAPRSSSTSEVEKAPKAVEVRIEDAGSLLHNPINDFKSKSEEVQPIDIQQSKIAREDKSDGGHTGRGHV